MPLEPLPWDRKEQHLRDRRKYERSSAVASESYRYPHQEYGGVMGVGGGGPRWRESHSHPNPKTNPYPYPHHPYRSPSPRWSPDFRSKPGPSGYGKQGSRQDGGHRIVQSRPNDRFLEDERFRASTAGRYTKFSRESKPFPSQKDSKGSFCEAAPSPDGPGRQNDTSAQQKSVDLLLASNSNHHSSSSYSFDQSQPKEQHEKNDGHDAPISSEPKEHPRKNDGLDAPVNSAHTFERANSFASIDWRTKWTGPGSLPSRSYSFSHSSISKSMGGVDCKEVKIDDTTFLSPSGDDDNPVTVHVDSATETCTTSEEISRFKKRRLGWGEGLAKFEKKKVEHTDDPVPRDDVMGCSSDGKEMHVLASNLTDKSPTIHAYPEFPSPTTPPTVSSSPLPVNEKKQLMMGERILHDNAKLSLSPGVVCQYHLERPNPKLENLDLEPIVNLNSAINDLPLSDDSSSVCSDFVTSTAINKLAVLKCDVLKVLELTESDIDKFECELKSMSEQEIILEQSSSSSSLPVDCDLESTHNGNAASAITCQHASLEIVSHPEMPYAEQLLAADVKNEDIDMYSSGIGFSVDRVNKVQSPSRIDIDYKVQSPLRPDTTPYVCWDASSSDGLNGDETSYLNAGYGSQMDDKLCEGILGSNRDSAIRSAEVFNKLVPANKCTSSIPIAIENTRMVKAKFLERKRFMQFKERILALKFRAFQHLWKEDVHMLSMQKFRVRSQKKMDLSLRPANSGVWKYRSPMHSRIAGDTRLLVNTETINFVGKLVSNNQVKPLRKDLKMPAFILDDKEKTMCRFVNTNGLVEDPCAVEKGRPLLNTWTEEEKEIFMDKLTTCGKDFTKIASFIVHKTTANCIEFYYKNHKFEWFQKPTKEGKRYLTNHYLITSGKRRIPEGNSASLNTLGAATMIASNDDDSMMDIQQKDPKKLLDTTTCKVSRNISSLQQRSASVDLDVLAGVCGSLSSETTSSCITSAIDSREGCHKRKKYKKKCASSRLPLTTEVSESVCDETCSGESIEELDDANWTDDEKSIFIQAISFYGMDFATISRQIKTRTVDQCKIFFSKARKCASLDTICPGSANVAFTEANDIGTDADCGCVDPGLHVFIKKSGIKSEGYSVFPDMTLTSKPNDAHNLNASLTVADGSERNDVLCDLQTADSKNPLDNVTNISQVEMPEQVLGVDGMGDNSKMVDVPSGSTSIIPSSIEAVDNISNSNNLSDQPDRQSAEKLSSDVAGLGPCFSETSVKEGSHKDNVISKDVSASEHDIKLKMHTSHAADIASCFHDISGSQQVNLHPDSLEKTRGLISSLQSNYPLPVTLVSGVFGAAKCGRASHGSLLQKCNGTHKQKSPMSEIPLQSVEQLSCNPCSKSDVFLGVDEPKQDGNFKLFGQIFTKPSSWQKPSQSIRQLRNGENQHEAGKSFSVELTGDSSVGGNPFVEKLDPNNFLDGENPTQTSFTVWDGSQIQTGFASLPVSVKPLTQYPDTFRNYPMSSKIEQPPLHEINGGNRSLEICNINRVFGYHQMVSSRDMQQQQPEVVLPKTLRNRLEGVENTARGMVGIHIGDDGNILVGRQHSGFSNSLEAMNLQQAKQTTENNMMIDECWMSNEGTIGM